MKRLLILALVVCSFGFVVAQEAPSENLTFFVGDEYLAIYVPSMVVLENLTFVVDTQTANYYPLKNYSALMGLLRGNTQSMCLILRLNTNQTPLPVLCQTLSTAEQPLVQSDVFWYDSVSRVRKTFRIINNNRVDQGMCPAGQIQCNFPYVETTPTPTPTPSNTPTPNQATLMSRRATELALTSVTPTPTIPNLFYRTPTATSTG